MRTKRLLMLLGSVCLAVMLVVPIALGCGEPAPEPASVPTYQWKLATNPPPDHPLGKSCLRYADKVREATNGRIDITVHAAGSLGDEEIVAPELMRGTIEMQAGSAPAEFEPRLEMVFLPYMVTTWDQVIGVQGTGGDLFNLYSELMRDLNIEVLSIFQCGFGGIGLRTDEMPPSPENPDIDKKMKIRIWAAKTPELLVQRLGYMPTPIPFKDVPSAMQMGVVDGVYGSDILSAYEEFRDVLTYWLEYRAFQYGYYYSINLDLWNSLSPEDQKILKDIAVEEERLQNAAIQAVEEEYTKKLTDYGVEVITFTPEELANIAAIVQRDVWPELEPMLGKEVMNEIIAAVKEL